MLRTELWRDMGIGVGRVAAGAGAALGSPLAAERDWMLLWRERELPAMVLPIVAALVRAMEAFDEVRRLRGER